MTQHLELLSPAKLNLFLHITGRRADGYHNLQTLFQLLDYGDTLVFKTNHSGQIRISGDKLDLAPEQNLITRAAKLLQRDDLGVDIEVSKRIPTGGGLGGGSSNAASTLLALNHLWHCGYSNSALQQLGNSLGADVPVFVAGHSAWAEGTGELLQRVELPQLWYLVVHPGCHISTAKIFSEERLTRDSLPITMAAFFQGASRNDCQDLVIANYPAVAEAIDWLTKFGEPRLTGTGACVFASFDSEGEALAVLQQLPVQWAGFVARGVKQSPVLSALP